MVYYKSRRLTWNKTQRMPNQLFESFLPAVHAGLTLELFTGNVACSRGACWHCAPEPIVPALSDRSFDFECFSIVASLPLPEPHSTRIAHKIAVYFDRNFLWASHRIRCLSLKRWRERRRNRLGAKFHAYFHFHPQSVSHFRATLRWVLVLYFSSCGERNITSQRWCN